MFARIARQYRRYLFGSVLLIVTMAIAFTLGITPYPEGMTHPVITPLAWFVLTVLVIGLPVTVLAVLLPGLLPLVELYVLTLLLLALASPPIYAVIGVDLPGWIDCALLAIAFILVERLLYGPWLAHLWRRDMTARSTTFTLPGTPKDVMPRLCPTPAQIGMFYWPCANVLPIPEGMSADFVLSLPRDGRAKDDLLAITMDNLSPPHQVRYRADPMPGSPTPAHCVTIAITSATEDTSHVTYTRQFLDVLFGKRLFFYLGNEFRDTIASIRARLGGRRDWSLQGAQMLKPQADTNTG